MSLEYNIAQRGAVLSLDVDFKELIHIIIFARFNKAKSYKSKYKMLFHNVNGFKLCKCIMIYNIICGCCLFHFFARSVFESRETRRRWSRSVIMCDTTNDSGGSRAKNYANENRFAQTREEKAIRK